VCVCVCVRARVRVRVRVRVCVCVCKNQTFRSWNYFLQVPNYQDFHIIGYQSEEASPYFRPF